MTSRLDSLEGLPEGIGLPAYDRKTLKAGILHLGPGAFFRSHLAFYTDATLAQGDGDWGIEAASLRSPEIADHLNAQHGLYTLLIRNTSSTTAQIVGSVLKAHAAHRDSQGLLARLADPGIRIVSMTVTEKAYGVDIPSGDLDLDHPDIAHDLANPHAPRGVIGYLVAGLARRRAKAIAPFTPLSCDNLPGNGKLLRRLVLAFADRIDPDLSAWIDANVTFPSTMVDRITPASTSTTLADAERLVGRSDVATVETEPFAQWVIEDRFVNGRPAWEKAGALLVDDVGSYEQMKLRMLNGTHSLLAYLGTLHGLDFIKDTMADASLKALARRHMAAAAATLEPLPEIDLGSYADQLIARFSNQAIEHRTSQIAMDGTQKLPQRLLEPAARALAAGKDAGTFAIATAAWMRYMLGHDLAGRSYTISDPRVGEITRRLADLPRTAAAISSAIFDLPSFFPDDLRQHSRWRADVEQALGDLLNGTSLDNSKRRVA